MYKRSEKRISILLISIGLVNFINIPLVAEIASCSNESTFNPAQCGHWAILRSCELLGVPIEMQTLIKLMPPNEKGADMLELRDVFKRIGLNVTGKRETLEGLTKGLFPAIAHFGDDHFVTVSVADDKMVRFFDGSGRAKTMKLSDFGKEWDNTLLVIERENRIKPLPSFINRKLKNQPRIEFDRLIIDKGDVRWNGKPIEYEFSVYNMGEAPLVIEDIKTNCKCLGAKSPNEPIAPGGKDTITLKYSIGEGQGSFKHEALVKSNDPSLPLVKLTAAGNTNTRIEINPKSVYLGNILPGQKKTATVSLHFTGDEPFDIRKVLCDKKQVKVVNNLLSQESASQFRYGTASVSKYILIIPNTYVLQITYEAGIKDIGKNEIDTIVIHTNIDGFEEISVPIYASVVEPVGLYPGVLLFSNVKKGEIVTKSIEVASLDGRPFQIVSVNTGNTGIEYSTEPGFTNRKTLRLSAKGETLLNLSEASIEIEVEVGGALPMKQCLKLPIYVK